ncbi:hypothetical protein BJ973_000287 [Actinoplanes tereljensis]|uniref:hypothetical protein n=1 Tax=Paractinoplanes tereljensis TaxID=571912 RepID=UPI001941D7B2|nr:hypothetical protein [Actinoplanes tereljensis]
MTSAEDVLRVAFDEAERRTVPLRVVASVLSEGDRLVLGDVLECWSGKYPGVSVSTSVRGDLDPAICLTAATRTCCLAVLSAPGDARTAAAVAAVARRASCPLVVLPSAD